MEHLPPVGWADVATKHDLDQLGAATKHDLDQLSAATKHDLDQLETRLEHRLLATFRAEMNAQIGAQTRIMIFAMATMFVGMSGVILTALSLS